MKRALTALLLLLVAFGTGVVAYAQGSEWKTLNDEVVSLYRKGRYDRAVVVAKKALEIAEANVGPYDASVAVSLSNLAQIYSTQGQYAAAEPLFKRALAINEKALGLNDPDL